MQQNHHKGNNLHVLGQIKFEVELPATDPFRHLAVFVEEGKSDLNDLQKIDVTPEVKVPHWDRF